MKGITTDMQREILEKTFITIDDVYRVLPVGKNRAAKIFREIEEDCKRKEIPIFITRPKVIPAQMLIDKYPILKRLRKGN